MSLDEILSALSGLPVKTKKEIIDNIAKATERNIWIPNPGPQTEALFCQADELFFGGQAGGGKTDLEIGLALTAHRRSLILRRTNKEALGVVERMADIIKTREGWSGQQGVWRLPERRTVEVSGCQLEEDKQ